jgi:hypothetical protein
MRTVPSVLSRRACFALVLASCLLTAPAQARRIARSQIFLVTSGADERNLVCPLAATHAPWRDDGAEPAACPASVEGCAADFGTRPVADGTFTIGRQAPGHGQEHHGER